MFESVYCPTLGKAWGVTRCCCTRWWRAWSFRRMTAFFSSTWAQTSAWIEIWLWTPFPSQLKFSSLFLETYRWYCLKQAVPFMSIVTFFSGTQSLQRHVCKGCCKKTSRWSATLGSCERTRRMWFHQSAAIFFNIGIRCLRAHRKADLDRRHRPLIPAACMYCRVMRVVRLAGQNYCWANLLWARTSTMHCWRWRMISLQSFRLLALQGPPGKLLEASYVFPGQLTLVLKRGGSPLMWLVWWSLPRNLFQKLLPGVFLKNILFNKGHNQMQVRFMFFSIVLRLLCPAN